MGCSSSNATSNATASTSNITNFDVVVQQVKQTWPDVKNIDKLAQKIFAHLLYKYPELKTFYHIPEAYKTEAELLSASEMKEPSDNFLSMYSDIIENSDTKFHEILQEKAIELNYQGVRASNIKFYGSSLTHVINYEFKDDFSIEEKQAWQSFTNQVSNGLAIELAKFPRKSIFQ